MVLLTATSRQRACQFRQTRGLGRGPYGACRAKVRRYSCDTQKPRIRIEPSFLDDIAESNDTAECGAQRHPHTQLTPVWLKLGDWSCSHDPRALQGADQAFRIAKCFHQTM